MKAIMIEGDAKVSFQQKILGVLRARFWLEGETFSIADS